MDTATAAAVTIRDAFPRFDSTLDYFDAVAGLIPEELLDWRPEDPSGGFMFSLAEIVMHTADARRMFAAQVTGESDGASAWTTSMGPNEQGIWEFRERPGREALLADLKASRAGFAPILDMPLTRLSETTDATRKSYENYLKFMEEQGREPDATLLRVGPGTILRVLTMTLAHEAGHRGSLQTLLHFKGISLPDE